MNGALAEFSCFPEREELTLEQCSLGRPIRASGHSYPERGSEAQARSILGLSVGHR